MLREQAPEHGAGADAPAIVTAEGHDIGSKAMEARQRVSGHAHHSIPLRLELDLADLRKRLFQRAPRPGAMYLETGETQRADAAEEKPSGLIETERVHDHPRVPAALAARQDRGPELGAQRFRGEIEIGDADLLALALRPWRALRVCVSGDHDPVRRNASAVGLETP